LFENIPWNCCCPFLPIKVAKQFMKICKGRFYAEFSWVIINDNTAKVSNYLSMISVTYVMIKKYFHQKIGEKLAKVVKITAVYAERYYITLVFKKIAVLSKIV
jgi:hypothetical protein